MNSHSLMRALRPVLLSILLGGWGAVALAAEPTTSAPIGVGGQATTFRASGSIDRVSRQAASITFFADAPFWGPPRYGAGQIMRWPKDTALVVFIPGPAPITIDGKKASFPQLAVGQQVDVQYNMQEGGIGCIAHRIDAHSATGTFISDGKAHTPRLLGHWRHIGPGVVNDYWFAADGTFKTELAQVGEPLRTMSGTWSLNGNLLDYNIIESHLSSFRPGSKDQDKIVQLTKEYYVLENRHGSQHRYVRLPK